MKRRDSPHSEEEKSREERRPERENAEPSQIDHESEDAGEAAAFVFPKPRRVHFHHSGCAERLQVAVHSADRDEQSEQAPE